MLALDVFVLVEEAVPDVVAAALWDVVADVFELDGVIGVCALTL